MLSADEVLDQLRTRLDRPASAQELVRRLRVPRESRATFRRRLRELVDRGSLVETRAGLYGLPDHMDLVAGRVTRHPDGYAFVEPETRAGGDFSGDVYVAGPHAGEAMHGDRVLVRIERRRDGNRVEGRIVRVLERGASTVVGRFDVDAQTGLAFVAPFDRRFVLDLHIPGGSAGRAVPGEMVAAAITQWPTPTRGPIGRIVDVLGPIDAPGVDTAVILRKHGIPDHHGDAALEEARRLGHEIRPRDLRQRTDFRRWQTVTIDGEHARDFDDAITLEERPDGLLRLGVHIADVAHYVPEGSALDQEALERGTSVYFPERAVHMFPEDLATGLCSLRPGVDRLVQSCVMDLDANGGVVHAEFHDGVIHSDARMTYTEVNAILTDHDPATRDRHAALVPLFERMQRAFEILNRRRRARGSVDFDLPEPMVLLDAQGLVEQILPAERNVAHRLIEEFMLLANETVAGFLDGHGLPALYRVHERPDPLKVTEFETFVSTLGYSLGVEPDAVRPRDFQRLVQRIAGTPEERPIAFLMLRTMQKARYDPANLGHFGLAAESYTHFTSPIRRYPDLVVHRVLRAARHGALDERRLEALAGTLPEIARHTSDRERRADEAERELIQWKKVRFMADKVGETFDGYVTGVAPFGLFVELSEHFVEGLVHVSSMADDYYRFDERTHCLRGENRGRRYRLGDNVQVVVARADLERRRIDLALLDLLERMSTDPLAGRRGAARPAGERAPRGEDPRGRPRRAGADRAGRRGERGGRPPAQKEDGARRQGRMKGRNGKATPDRPPRRAQRPGRRERAARKRGR
jgi:ribonuclease R